MATKSKAPAAPVEEERKSRTIYVSDSEWAEITVSANKQGRKVSRHLVMLVRAAASK